MTAPATGIAPSTRAAHIALVLLSLSSGTADAFAFLALNGTFTANMTGNLVLAGLFTRPEFARTVVCSILAILAFAALTYAGFRLIRAMPHADPRTVLRRLLLPSLALQALAGIIWLVVGDRPHLTGQGVVIVLSAGALGLQTVAAKTLSDVSGITTTFVTGTLTSVMQAFADRSERGQLVRVLSVLALPAGAVAGTALFAAAPLAGPVLPVILTLAAVANVEAQTIDARTAPGVAS